MPGTGQQRRILFLCPFPPDPQGVHGGSRAIGQLIQRLAARNDVGLVYLRAPGEPGIGTGLERVLVAEEVERPDRQSTRTRRLSGATHAAVGLMSGRPAWVSDWLVPGYSGRVAKVVADWQPDIVQAEFHVMGQYLAGLRGAGPGMVLVPHDPGAASAADRARAESGLRAIARRVDAMAWRRYERSVLGAAHAAVAFTQQDSDRLKELAGTTRVVRIPVGVDLPARALDPVGKDPPGVLFVGNLIHPPNVQAALDLASYILPEVRARFPDVILEIVGDNPPPAVRRLSMAGVVVTGRVEDVVPHLDRAAVVAVPTRLGGGMRIKVLEALAAGKAVVATGRALAGIDLVPGEHALVAETDHEFAEAIGALLADPSLRERLGTAAREWTGRRLRWEDSAAAYEALYESLLAHPRSVSA